MADLRPKIRFSGYEDSWVRKNFNDIFDILSNNTLSRDKLNYESGTACNVHYGDVLVKFGEYLNAYKEILPYINDETVVAKFQNAILRDGDIIIADTAEDETVGKCTEIGEIGDKVILSGLHTIPCRSKQSYSAKYLGYCMNSEKYHKKLLPLMQGVKVLAISKSGIQSTDITVTENNHEQADIGSFLSSLDELLKLETEKLEKIKIIKQAMFKKLFPQKGKKVPEIRFAGFTDDWEQRKLNEIYQNIGNAFVGTATPYYVESGHFYLESNNVKDGQINRNNEIFINDEFYEKQKDKWLHTGDMVMVQSGHVGHAAVISEELDNSAAHALIMFRNPKVKIEPYFLNYQYQTAKTKKKIENITTGNTIKHILASDMQEFIVDVPKIEEQEEIAKCFKNLDHLITLHQSKIDKLQHIKSTCMKKLFV